MRIKSEPREGGAARKGKASPAYSRLPPLGVFVCATGRTADAPGVRQALAEESGERRIPDRRDVAAVDLVPHESLPPKEGGWDQDRARRGGGRGSSWAIYLRTNLGCEGTTSSGGNAIRPDGKAGEARKYQHPTPHPLFHRNYLQLDELPSSRRRRPTAKPTANQQQTNSKPTANQHRQEW